MKVYNKNYAILIENGLVVWGCGSDEFFEDYKDKIHPKLSRVANKYGSYELNYRLEAKMGTFCLKCDFCSSNDSCRYGKSKCLKERVK